MPRKTPQQKKAESYKKDRRNVYGENDKASRKAIPLNKALSHRKVRRRFKDVRLNDEEGLTEAKLKKASKQAWKKCPDKPLGTVLGWQKEKRAKLVNRKVEMRKEKPWTPSTDELKKKAKWFEQYYLYRVKEEPSRKDWQEGLDTSRRWLKLHESPTLNGIQSLFKFLKEHEHEHGSGWLEMRISIGRWIAMINEEILGIP